MRRHGGGGADFLLGGGRAFWDLTFGLSGRSSTFGQLFCPFPCLFGFCLHREPETLWCPGEAVSSAAARTLPGVPARFSPLHPVEMTLLQHRSSESLDVGRWGLEPRLLSSPLPRPSPAPFSGFFSSSFTLPTPLQVPRRELIARGSSRPGPVRAGSGLRRMGERRAGLQVDTGPPSSGGQRQAGAALGCAGAAEPGRSVRRRDLPASGCGPRGGGSLPGA